MLNPPDLKHIIFIVTYCKSLSVRSNPFAVISTGLALAMVMIFSPADADAVIEDNLYKFDEGFYDKIVKMQGDSDVSGQIESQVTKYTVIIVMDNVREGQLREKLQMINAENIFVDDILDYVIADVSIDQIPSLALEDGVIKIGDGNEPLEPHGLTMSQTKSIIGAVNIPSSSYDYTGSGVTVGIIDTGVDFSHPDLPNKKAGKAICNSTGCNSTNARNANAYDPYDHGTALAVIIAGDSSNNSRDGMAPDARIYSSLLSESQARISSGTAAEFAVSLSNLLEQDIKIAMTSLASVGICGNYLAINIILDRAVDEGLYFSTPIGNHIINSDGDVSDWSKLITRYSCGFNHITVGSVDHSGNHFIRSASGPAEFHTPSGDAHRIKPDILAPGVNLDTATVVRPGQSNYKTDTGTSYANAFVAGASALVLEKQPDYRPLEIKSALILGAKWKANVSATANNYDSKVLGIYDQMNKYGFGVLDVEKSLDYANDNEFPNIIYEINRRGFPDKQYRITASQGDQVKVLLSWFIHPRGTIGDPTLPINHPHIPFTSQMHNFDLAVKYPDGTIRRSTSDIQNNEFVVFNAPRTGHYAITVSSDGTVRTTTDEPFVIASTHPLDKHPFSGTDDGDQDTSGGSFIDGFANLNRWDLSGQDWIIGSPSQPVPGEGGDNTVARSFDCDRHCILELKNALDTSDPVIMTFDRYVDDAIDAREGLYVQYSTDDATWITLAEFGHDNGEDTDRWEEETITLDIPQSSASLRFLAISTRSSEIVELDNLSVTIRTGDGGGGTNPPPARDTTRPVITVPSDVTAEATGGLTTVDIDIPTVTDNRDPNPAVTNNAPPSGFPVGATIVTWTATDRSGNSAIATQTVTVRDTTPPVIMTPRDIITEATDDLTMVGIGTVTAADLVDSNPDITNDAPSGGYPIGITTVTWTATDDYDNSAVARQTITVRDTTAPAVTAPQGVTAEATGQLTPVNIGTATATDVIDQSPAITNDAPSKFPLGTTTVTWTAIDDHNNAATATQTITMRDTTAPAITAPQDVTADATGPFTTVNIGTATATDTVDSSPTITNDAPSGGYPIGTTTITWTATDDYGNAATAIQTITVQGDTSHLAINAPDTLKIAAKGIFTGYNLTVDAPGAATLTNDAPEYFPFGNTTVTWTAMGYSGNTAIKETLVTVSPDSLDADWQYRIAGLYFSIGPTKGSYENDSILFHTSDVGSGTIFLFKTFPKSSIINRDILVDARTIRPGTAHVAVFDGAYSNVNAADFGSTSVNTKGGGMLYMQELGSGAISPDWSKSQLDEVTVMFIYTKRSVGAQLIIDSVEFSGHSKWIFDDYLVEQAGSYGRYMLISPSIHTSTIHDIPINDRFNLSFDGWMYWGSTSEYTLENGQDNGQGRLPGAIHLSTDEFTVYAGVSKLVDTSGLGDDRLVISYDYRAFSGSAHSAVTNTRMVIQDYDSGDLLHAAHPVHGGTKDTGWQTYTEDITQYVANSDTVRVSLQFYDSWVARWSQGNWYDNIRIYTLDQPDPVLTINTYTQPVTGQVDPGNSTGPIEEEVVEMADIRVEDVDDTGITIGWDAAAGTEYKVVIAPAGEPRNKFSDLTYDNTYTFVNLAPNTWYDISVGVRGDDSTKYRMVAMTLPDDMVAPDDLVLRASTMPGMDRISVEWDDDNNIGGNTYRVERSIHGGQTAALRLTQDHAIHDNILPDWLGQTISYKVFERAGSQKIYSNEVNIILPDALEPPQNVRAEALGGTIQLSWDEAPIARNYLVDGLVDGQWLRIDKVQDSQFEYTGQADAFRITTQLGPAESAPSDTVHVLE